MTPPTELRNKLPPDTHFYGVVDSEEYRSIIANAKVCHCYMQLASCVCCSVWTSVLVGRLIVDISRMGQSLLGAVKLTNVSEVRAVVHTHHHHYDAISTVFIVQSNTHVDKFVWWHEIRLYCMTQLTDKLTLILSVGVVKKTHFFRSCLDRVN